MRKSSHNCVPWNIKSRRCHVSNNHVGCCPGSLLTSLTIFIYRVLEILRLHPRPGSYLTKCFSMSLAMLQCTKVLDTVNAGTWQCGLPPYYGTLLSSLWAPDWLPLFLDWWVTVVHLKCLSAIFLAVCLCWLNVVGKPVDCTSKWLITWGMFLKKHWHWANICVLFIIKRTKSYLIALVNIYLYQVSSTLQMLIIWPQM